MKTKQLAFKLPQHGGARKGAGRKAKGEKPGVPHLRRAPVSGREPVHVTLRIATGVGHLRSYSRTRVVKEALRAAKERLGLRVVHYSIQGNHLHLIVEPDGPKELARGMQGLAIRIAKALNRLAARRGPVFSDRYHSHVLKTPREAAHAVRYVLENYRHHTREYLADDFVDPHSSACAPLVFPRTWLLRSAPP